MARLSDVSPGDLITSQRQNDINDYIQDGTEYLITASAQLVAVSAAPSDGDLALGRLYADSDDNKLYFYNGTSWIDITGAGSATYDAIVASSGGDYTTLGAAITGGATSIFVKDGTYNETGDITTPSNCTIVGESKYGAIVNMQTYQLTLGTNNFLHNLRINTSWVQTNGDADAQIIVDDNTMILNCVFFNQDNTDPATMTGLISDGNTAATRVQIIGCFFRPLAGAYDFANRAAIHQDSTGSSGWRIDNCYFAGEDATRQFQVMIIEGNWNAISNIVIADTGGGSDRVFEISGDHNALTNMVCTNTSGGDFIISGDDNKISGVSADRTDHKFEFTGLYNTLGDVKSAGSYESTGRGNIISNCVFENGITITSADDNMITGCRAGVDGGGGANTITITAGTDGLIITNSQVDADIADSGTDTAASYYIY